MKKKILFVLLIGLILTNYSFAQEESMKKYRGTTNIGIAHSFNSTSFAGVYKDNIYLNKTEDFSASPRATLSFGFMAEFFVLNNLSIETNALIASCGSYLHAKTTIYNEVGVFEGKTNTKYILRYIKVPLVLNFYPTEKFYLTAGGYGSTLLESKEYTAWYEDSHAAENVNYTDYGIVAGFGLNTNFMRVGLQYSLGLTPVIDDKSLPELNNQMIEIVLRWKIYSEARKK